MVALFQKINAPLLNAALLIKLKSLENLNKKKYIFYDKSFHSFYFMS